MSKKHKLKHKSGGTVQTVFDLVGKVGGAVTGIGGNGNDKGAGSSGGGSYYAEKCYNSHPAYKLPGTELVIYGGSCINPIIDDADIYVGFDAGMRPMVRQTPWNSIRQYYCPIPDMGVPQSDKLFDLYVQYVAKALKGGKKVHCGCIGGHGRTGMFLAALCKTISPETVDAITHVRENYCKRAVESEKQVDWLGEKYGIKKVPGYKSPGGGGYAPLSPHTGTQFKTPPLYTGSHGVTKVHSVVPIKEGCFWK